MGLKLIWTGVFFLLAVHVFGFASASDVVGAILFLIGLILMWLDR